jgi:anaerobic selenocysteine-containing dehydrogenase
VRVGECRSDEEIFVDLARRMNLPVGTESVDEVLASQLAAGCGIGLAEIRERGFHVMPMRYRKHEERGFRTPTGRIELYSTRLEAMGCDPLPHYEEPPESPLATPDVAREFPLVLTTGARIPFFFNSEHRQIARLREAHPDPIVEIHPDTAAAAGIGAGDWVVIETRRGRIRQKARLTDGIDPRVVHVEHGWWFPEQDGPEHGVWQSNANVLTSNAPPYDPAMGTYQLRALLCRIERAAP